MSNKTKRFMIENAFIVMILAGTIITCYFLAYTVIIYSDNLLEFFS